MNGISGITTKIKDKIKQWGAGFKSGLGHILKYVGSLFSLQNIYPTLSNLGQSWLSSQNVGAQQMSANIEYMKYAMGGTFAPVIEYVINLVYQLMKAIQSVVYAFSGINIFAKATASSMGKTAGSAKQASKSLNGVHGEINNISESDNPGGNTSISPSIDLSGLDSQMSPIAQKLYNFFKPLKDSWNTYGGELITQLQVTAGQVGGLIGSVWASFENIITNGTVYLMLQNILTIIGNIAEAFSNAWNNNGNGDAIIQNLSNAFNNLLDAINNIVSSSLFQWILDVGVKTIKIITDVIKGLSDAVLWVIEKLDEFIEFFTGESNEKLNGWAIIIGSIAIAIGLVVGAITLWNIISGIAAIATSALGVAISILTSPITLVILAIAALIAIIVSIIVYWDEISAALSVGWEWIKQKAIEIFTAIGDFFTNIWQGICDVVTTIWNNICNFFTGIWDWIVQTVTNTFNNIRQFISDALNGISIIWNSIWGGISSFLSNIWNEILNTISNVWNTIVTKVKEGVSGAWNAITSVFGGIASWFGSVFRSAWEAVKNVFSKGGEIFNGIKEGILNGLKTVINAIIGGINKVIAIPFNGINSALMRIKNIEIIGFKPFSWINAIGVPQIPQLAKGNVAYSPLIAQFGEYTGASHNPEITAPQNILKETFENVLLNYEWNNKAKGQPIRVQIYWGTKSVVDEIIDGINEKTRQTGKAQIKVAYEY